MVYLLPSAGPAKSRPALPNAALSQVNPADSPGTENAPTVSGAIANLPAACDREPYARYFRNKNGGGELHFVADGTVKKIDTAETQTFKTAKRRFRQAATLVSKIATPSAPHTKSFCAFRSVNERWNQAGADVAVDQFLAAQAAVPAPDNRYRDLYTTQFGPQTAQAWDQAQEPIDFANEDSIRQHLLRMGAPKPGDPENPQNLAMFGTGGPHLNAILCHLDQLGKQMAVALPPEYAGAATALDTKTLQGKMITAIGEHYRKYQDADAAKFPSVALRCMERALHKAYGIACKAAENARKQLHHAQNAPPDSKARDAETKLGEQHAGLTAKYAEYIRGLKRFVTTQAAPWHFKLAAFESVQRFGPQPKIDDGKTSSSKIEVAGGAKAHAAVTVSADVGLIGSTGDFIDIDGDRNHIRVNGLKVGFNLKEGFNAILSLYANQSIYAQYTNGRYLAHSDPNSHFHALYQNYVEHPRRAAIGERFMRWLVDRSADPRNTGVRISMDHFFSEFQRFISGTESLSTTDALPRYASIQKMARGRNGCDLHRTAAEIDAIVHPRTLPENRHLPSLTSALQAAIPLRARQMDAVFAHLHAAAQARQPQQIAEELEKATRVVDDLIRSPDVPPVPGAANAPGSAEQDPAYWGTARVGAAVNAGAGLNTRHFEKAKKVFSLLSGAEKLKTGKPKAPNFNPTAEARLDTDAAFRIGGLQRLNIDPYKALSPLYLASKPTLLNTMKDVRDMLTEAAPDGPHPHLVFVDRFDAFPEMRILHPYEGPPPAGVHARDAWLEDMLRQKKATPAQAAESLTGSYARAARQMAAFMSVENGALHSAPQSPDSVEAVQLINDNFWQGRHTIDPASATREEIDGFLAMTRGMVALACADIDKNMALVIDAATRQRSNLSPMARQRFDKARTANAAYARFIAKCFDKGNDLGNEYHARHATVLQPGPSKRHDFTATVALPSLKIPVLNAAIPAGSTLDTALGPVTENLSLVAGLNLTYQSTVFAHPAPLPRSGTGDTYTVAGRLSVLLGAHFPAMLHAIRAGATAAATNAKDPKSARLTNYVLGKFAGNDFPADLQKVFHEEMERTAAPKGLFQKIFHALTGTETSGVTVRRFTHEGVDQPTLTRDLTLWVDIKGGLTVMPEVLGYFQPGTTLRAGGALTGVKHVTLAHRLGNDPFYNSMNFVKTGGLNTRLKRDAAGHVDLQDLRAMFNEKDEDCRTWMSGAVPGSLGAIVDNYEQLLDFVSRGGPQAKVPGNALGALQNKRWRAIVDNAHQWSKRDPKDTTELEKLDEPGLLQQVLQDARSAPPLSGAVRQRFKAMSAAQRMDFLVRQRPDILQTVFKLYTALNTANAFVKNTLGYGPAPNTLFGRPQVNPSDGGVPAVAPSPVIDVEADDGDDDDVQLTWL